MKPRRKLAISLAVAAALGAGIFANRLQVLQYSLGWHTDFKYPRDPNRPVPWMNGPPATVQPTSRRPPNIIVIMADDLGSNDVSTLGGGQSAEGVPTPNIDANAREGVRFDQGYAAAPVCTVLRVALMTGRYPWRFGVSYNGGKWFEPSKYLTDYFTDEAVTAIKRKKNQPFFMFLAHWGVHTPLTTAHPAISVFRMSTSLTEAGS